MSRPLPLADLCRTLTSSHQPFPLPSGTGLLHSGLTIEDAETFARWLESACTEETTWADYNYRRVWIHHAGRYTVTYCEGDIQILACPDDQTWSEWLAYSASFYACR